MVLVWVNILATVAFSNIFVTGHLKQTLLLVILHVVRQENYLKEHLILSFYLLFIAVAQS